MFEFSFSGGLESRLDGNGVVVFFLWFELFVRFFRGFVFMYKDGCRFRLEC